MRFRESVEWKRMIYRIPQSKEQHDALGVESPSDKAEHLERLAIEPLGIIHEARERPVCRGCTGQQSKRCQSHEKSVGRSSFGLAKRRLQRCTLRTRKTRLLGLPRKQKSLQSGKTQLHFGFETGDASSVHARL